MNTNLDGANLTWANLERAELDGAKLDGTNHKEAHYLTFDQLSKVKCTS